MPSVTKRVEQQQLQQKLSHDSSARLTYFSKSETVCTKLWHWTEVDVCNCTGSHWTSLISGEA